MKFVYVFLFIFFTVSSLHGKYFAIYFTLLAFIQHRQRPMLIKTFTFLAEPGSEENGDSNVSENDDYSEDVETLADHEDVIEEFLDAGN